MKKLVGIVGSGMIGRDPFDPQCWSGSSAKLFNACKSANRLHRAFGVEANKIAYGLIALKNFSTDRAFWRNKFSLDVLYYRALTREVERNLNQDDFEHDILQIGAIYDVPLIVDGRTQCYSYHDGNLAQLSKSPHFDPRLKSFVKSALQWEYDVYQKMDKIFTMSDYLRKSFIHDFNIHPSKVSCIGVGPNVPVPTYYTQKTADYLNILFIGIDFVRKGGELVVEAFNKIKSKYPNARLHIVGPRVEPDCIKCNHSNIIFHGFLDRRTDQLEKLIYIFQITNLAILPSKYEPFGIVVVECMYFGSPVIATDNWAFPEMITPGVNGELIQSGTATEIADYMDFYLSDRDKLTEQGVNAFNAVKNKYSWELVVKNIQQEIRS